MFRTPSGKHNKPVYGLFIAIRIDTNTAETFRHGVWYAKGDEAAFNYSAYIGAIPQKYFEAMFQAKQAAPGTAQRADWQNARPPEIFWRRPPETVH